MVTPPGFRYRRRIVFEILAYPTFPEQVAGHCYPRPMIWIPDPASDHNGAQVWEGFASNRVMGIRHITIIDALAENT